MSVSTMSNDSAKICDIPVVVSVAVVDSGGGVELGREEVTEEGGKVSEAEVDASEVVKDEAMSDDNLPEEVEDSGAVVGEEEAAVVVISSLVVVDVPEAVAVNSEAESVVLGAWEVLGAAVVEGALVVVCSAAVVCSAVVDAGAEAEDVSAVDSAVVLAGSSMNAKVSCLASIIYSICRYGTYPMR